MPLPDRTDAEPPGPPVERPASKDTDEPPTAPSAPGDLTTLLCERCGNEHLIRVKGCWYCEKCHYKFDCSGF